MESAKEVKLRQRVTSTSKTADQIRSFNQTFARIEAHI